MYVYVLCVLFISVRERNLLTFMYHSPEKRKQLSTTIDDQEKEKEKNK